MELIGCPCSRICTPDGHGLDPCYCEEHQHSTLYQIILHPLVYLDVCRCRAWRTVNVIGAYAPVFGKWYPAFEDNHRCYACYHMRPDRNWFTNTCRCGNYLWGFISLNSPRLAGALYGPWHEGKRVFQALKTLSANFEAPEHIPTSARSLANGDVEQVCDCGYVRRIDNRNSYPWMPAW